MHILGYLLNDDISNAVSVVSGLLLSSAFVPAIRSKEVRLAGKTFLAAFLIFLVQLLNLKVAERTVALEIIYCETLFNDKRALG